MFNHELLISYFVKGITTQLSLGSLCTVKFLRLKPGFRFLLSYNFE